jgi:hypothetical protein
MASEREEEQRETKMAGASGRAGQPLLMVAAFAAGAGAALGTKALLDSRRRGSYDEDLPTVLRRTGLDLAIAATNQAAERLGEDSPEARDEQPVPGRS